MSEPRKSSISQWLQKKSMDELDEYARRDEAFDRLADWEKVAINNTRGVDRLVSELVVIKWVLVAIAIIIATMASHFAPGWWRLGLI